MIQKGVYYHYKNPRQLYEVIGVGKNTENDELTVIYKPLYKSEVEYWVRPYEMFIGTVEIDGRSIPRFKRVDSSAAIAD